MGQIDLSILEKQSQKFVAYVHAQDHNDEPLEFIKGNGIMVKNEGYKSFIPGKARDVLRFEEWDSSWIGSGNIKDRISKAVDMSANLMNFYAKTDFKNRFVRNQFNAERAIYEIYKGNDDKTAFEHATEVFGAKYPTIAYLFFIKDENKYLPTSPNCFDRAFKELKISFTMSSKCSWDNYSTFISLIREIGIYMPRYMDIQHEVRLLDAHSFVWVIGEKQFINWSTELQGINTPLAPKSISKGPNGASIYQCGRCDYSFTAARRCPECGQLVKVEVL